MALRILHTSDWHLGKKLFKKSRLPEQKLFLNWLLEQIKSKKIELLLISGDIYDVPTPPNEASKIYYEFLNSLTEQTNCHVFIIPGNHDSATYLDAPTEFLKKHRIHIFTGVEDFEKNNIKSLKINNHPVAIKALPYFRTYELYNAINKDREKNINIDTEQIGSYLKNFMQTWPKDIDQKSFKIIMAHHAFGHFSATGSEQALMLSGLESIPLDWPGDQFDYMALGHIHKAQMMDEKRSIYYSGSPIPLRFSETHTKKIILIDVDDKNQKKIEKVSIPVFRPIIQLKGNEEDIFDKIDKSTAKYADQELDIYLEVIIELKKPDNKFNDKVFKHIESKNIKLLSFIPVYKDESDETEQKPEFIEQMNINDLFKYYYKKKYPDVQDMPKHLIQDFIENLEEINHEDNLS